MSAASHNSPTTAEHAADTVVLVYVTCPDDASAQAIAQQLVADRHAACISALPGVQSTYRWQGVVETATETQLLIKTRAARLDAVRTTVSAMHPDAVPELIAVAVHDGAPQYLDWVVAETR